MATTTDSTLARRAQLFHALSDETRLAILELLRGGERCVCDLQSDLDAAQSRLSFHLRVLREAGLVEDRKEGRWSYYTLRPERLEAAAQALTTLGRPTARRAASRALPTFHQLTRTAAGPNGSRAGRTARAGAEAPDDCCG